MIEEFHILKISCDSHEGISKETFSAPNSRLAMEKARAAGWYMGVTEQYCPSCAPKRPKPAALEPSESLVNPLPAAR